MNIQLSLYKIEQENFLNYLSLLEKTLKKHRKNMEKWLKEQKSKIIKDGGPDFFASIEESEYESLERHSNLAFESFAVWLYAYLENELNQVCNRFTLRQKSTLELSNIAGKGIERSRIFMKKVAKWQLPKEDLWRELIFLRDIRHAIVHNGRIIKKPKLKTFINKQNKDEIFCLPNGRIVLNKEFCVKLTNFVFDYLEELSEIQN